MNKEPAMNDTNPQQALEEIRKRLKAATQEYSSGRLSKIQFEAVYRHYAEKRQIIERLIERNPESDAWKSAASEGTTSYLKDRFEARPLYYMVMRQGDKQPLIADGKVPRKAAEQIYKLLQAFWKMSEWKSGLARKAIGDGMWMMIMVGEMSLTIVIYFLQPSTVQITQLRDLQSDFERANRQALERGLPAKRMVFPQRAMFGLKN
ncbi:MAG: hypothetical protein WBC91_21965 [Phototrophicaceae bacterium]